MPEVTPETAGGVIAGGLAAVAALTERVWRHHGRLGRIEQELEAVKEVRKEAKEDLEKRLDKVDQTQGKIFEEMKKHGECLAVICDRLEISG